MERVGTHAANAENWIGVFDSGIGGVAVLKEMLHELPNEKILYLGDNLHNPYGMRTLENIRDLATTIARHLLRLPAKLIVVACNTASAAALTHLRNQFPQTPFVGMEPAVKPAALHSRTGKIGVLATPATFEGEPFKRLRDTFADDAEIFSQPCPGLADAIEQQGPDSPEVEKLLHQFVTPLIPLGVDQLVLACTHYPFVMPAIRRITGEKIHIIDPSPAVAKQARRILKDKNLLSQSNKGETVFQVSGNPDMFSRTASMFLKTPVHAEQVQLFGTPAASAK